MIDIAYSEKRAEMLVRLAEHDMYLQAIYNMMEAGWSSVTIADIINLSTEDKERFGVTDALMEVVARDAQKLGLLP